ncbi:MAG: M42 family metallopeptidase [Desulfurococcales archaeon]|nr:M42 family metallopeptidase [Desulfurococcales archaeon]
MAYLDSFKPDKGLLEDLILTPGVSGFEDPVRSYILEFLGKYGKPRVDRLGNIIFEAGGEGPRLLIAAHMDELGLLVTGIEESGLLAFRKVGGIDDSILPSTHVVVHGSKGPVPGVIGAEPPHLRITRKAGEQGYKPWHELRIDVGAESREEAVEMGIEPFTPVVFRKQVTYMAGERYVATRGIDDRAGCATLMELLRLVSNGVVRPRVELILAWTVEEEIGIIGARALARELEPDYFIAVDTMTCCHPSLTGSTRLGAGPVVRAMDNYYITSPRLAKAVYKAGSTRGLQVQVATAGGGTDAAAFHYSGVPSVAVSVPVQYTHSLVEKMHTGDYAGWTRLLAAVVESGLED